MNLITALKLRNRTAPSALDVICATETIREILDAMTAKQLVVAALLIQGWTLREIADELSTDERPVTWQAVAHRRRAAQERVARTMIHVNAEHLAGDVMARRFWKKERRNHSSLVRGLWLPDL